MKALLFLLALACTASARVGDTLAELRQRLKQEPITERKGDDGVISARFALGDSTYIDVQVVDGTVSLETYMLVKELAYAEAILAKYEQKWEKGLQMRDRATWKSAKGYSAEFDGRVLHISDGRYDRVAAAKLKEEAAKFAERF